MEFTNFVRKPFVVDAVEITEDNIEEAAKFIGELRTGDEENSSYILVDPRLVPNVERVYLGFWMTRMGRNVHCYSRRIFFMQFVEQDDNMTKWLAYMEEKTKEANTPQPAEWRAPVGGE